MLASFSKVWAYPAVLIISKVLCVCRNTGLICVCECVCFCVCVCVSVSVFLWGEVLMKVE